MVIASDTRIKIRGALTGLGFVRSGYTNVTEPGGPYTETWTNDTGESVDITWGGYPTEASRHWGKSEPRTDFVSHA